MTETRKFDDDFVVDPRWWEHQFAQTVTPGTGKTWTYVVEPISFHAEEEIAFTKGTRWQTIRWRIATAIDGFALLGFAFWAVAGAV